jgi:predicted DNA-binding antitoxin AbrB/MazE fold protein
MTIPAKYEDGVFKPLEDVQLTEGTRVEVYVPAEGAPARPRSLRDLAAFGMRADREDIPDGVTYENRMRQPRLSVALITRTSSRTYAAVPVSIT